MFSTLVRSVLSCVCLASVLLGGCLISSHSNESFTGTQVSEETFSRIEPGVTTKQWVLGTLGEPTVNTPLEDGAELWKWTYSKCKTSNGSIFLIFGGSSVSTTAGAAYVQMKDGIVTKCWRTS